MASAHASPLSALELPLNMISESTVQSPMQAHFQPQHHSQQLGHQPSPAALDFDALFKQFEDGSNGDTPDAIGSGQQSGGTAALNSLKSPPNILEHHEAVRSGGPNGSTPQSQGYMDFDLGGFGLDGQQNPEQGNGSEQPQGYGGNDLTPSGSDGWKMNTGSGDQTPYSQQRQQDDNGGPRITDDQMFDQMSGMPGFEAIQASLLQQQLEQIHMQSPAIFGNQSQQSHPSQMPVQSGSEPTNGMWTISEGGAGMYGMGQGQRDGRSLSMALAAGQMLTPAQSSEMYPNMHQGMVSPLPVGMYQCPAGTIGFEETRDPAFTPLMSPALQHFRSSGNNFPSDNSSQSQRPSQSDLLAGEQQLLQIRMQEQQLQRQLDQLHRQQQQIIASSTSPYISPQQQGTNSVGPQMNGQYSSAQVEQVYRMQGRGNERFSPLTSPALMPTNGRQQHRQRHMSDASLALRQTMNPAGAQQTLSPALGPQVSDWQGSMTVEQLEALTGSLVDESSSKSTRSLPSVQESGSGLNTPNGGMSPVMSQWSNGSGGHTQTPHYPSSQMSTSSTPVGSPSAGPGPHRNSQPGSRARPSPLIKPTYRSTRTPNVHAANIPIPPSPLIAGPGAVGRSPRVHNPHNAAEENMAAVMGNTLSNMSAGSGSGSTPSPVDLNHLAMPPPPVPLHSLASKRQAGLAPITPASLMRMSGEVKAIDFAQIQPKPLTGIAEGSSQGESSTNGRATASRARTGSGDSRNPGEAALMPPPPQRVSSVASRQKAAGTASRLGIRPIAPHGQPNHPHNDAADFAKNSKAAKAAAKKAEEANLPPEVRRTSHKAAEQKRRDSLKAGFDELRLLLPPINTEALDPESGEPIPGSSAPRLLPKNSLVPDDNPNKGVSKVALLKYSNEYIGRLHAKIDRRNDYIELLKESIRSTRLHAGLPFEEHIQDLLEYAFEDEEEDDEPPTGVTAAAKDRAAAEADMDDDGELSTADMSRESSPQLGRSGTGNQSTRQPQAPLTRRQSITASKRKSTGGTTPSVSPALRAHNPRGVGRHQHPNLDVEMS